MGQTSFSGPVKSDNGFIENSFTTAERDAIQNPVIGLLIYNTTTNSYEVYGNSGFQPAFAPPVPAPNVSSVSPNTGSVDGGESVTVSGTNFTGATSVKFGGVSATSVVVVNSTTITCVTPAVTAGAVAVSVTTSGGTGTLNSAFTYESAPAIPTFAFTESADSAAGAFAVTPNGMTVYAKNGGSIGRINLVSPWDVTGSSTGMPVTLPFDMFVNQTATMAFNGDGTKLITIGQDAGYYPGYYTLGTAYTPSSYSGGFVKGGPTVDITGTPSQLFYLNGGTKACVMDNMGNVYLWTLDSAYDFASFSGTADSTNNLSTLFSIGTGGPVSFVLNDAGTIGYFAWSGSGYDGALVQFSLGTPYDLSTISATPIDTVTGWGTYSNYGAIALKPTTEDVIFVNQNSGALIQQFNAV